MLSGQAEIGGRTVHAGQIAWSDPVSRPGDPTTLALNTGDGDDQTKVMLFAGRPIGESVYASGPFVMNTRAEIEQAYRDFHSGTFGSMRRTTSARRSSWWSGTRGRSRGHDVPHPRGRRRGHDRGRRHSAGGGGLPGTYGASRPSPPDGGLTVSVRRRADRQRPTGAGRKSSAMSSSRTTTSTHTAAATAAITTPASSTPPDVPANVAPIATRATPINTTLRMT